MKVAKTEIERQRVGRGVLICWFSLQLVLDQSQKQELGTEFRFPTWAAGIQFHGVIPMPSRVHLREGKWNYEPEFRIKPIYSAMGQRWPSNHPRSTIKELQYLFGGNCKGIYKSCEKLNWVVWPYFVENMLKLMPMRVLLNSHRKLYWILKYFCNKTT